MNWLLTALLSAFAVVTAILCFICCRSPKESRRERVIVYHHDGYEIEPADVPQFEPSWRNQQSENLAPAEFMNQRPKGWSRS